MQKADPGPPLDTNPFLAPGDDQLFYATAQITQRLNLLHHLIRYGDQAIVVSGPEGSGKTTLVDRLLREGNSSWRATVVEAVVEMTGERLLARALTGLDLRAEVVTTRDGLDALRAHLTAAGKSGVLTLVVVDDAHYLSSSVMDMLLKQVGTADAPGFRLLLVGDEDLPERVAGALGEALFHLVELPPLGREQAMHYITTRLDRSGTPARDLFSEDTVDGLWRQSGGYPGPLNRLAARIIETAVRPAAAPTSPAAAARTTPAASPAASPPEPRPPGRDRRLLWLIGGAAVATVIVTTALLQGGDESRPPLTRPLPTPGRPPAVVETPAPPPAMPPVTEPTTLEEAPPPAASADAAPQPREAPGKADESAGETPDPPATAAVVAAVPTPATPAPPAAPKPAPVVQEAPATRAPPEPAVAPPPETQPTVVAEPWPFNLAADRYVLQFMGSHERSAVARQIKKHGLEAPVAVVQLVHQGRPWYVLVHGDYANRDAAIAAIRGLPGPVRALKPWARSVASIREAAPPPAQR